MLIRLEFIACIPNVADNVHSTPTPQANRLLTCQAFHNLEMLCIQQNAQPLLDVRLIIND